MSKAKSSEEARIPGEKAAQASGRPDKHEPGLKNETSGVMKAPKDSGEHGMGGVHKGGDSHLGHSGMSHARAQLEMETERGAHCAEVGGHKMPEHSGRMGHKG